VLDTKGLDRACTAPAAALKFVLGTADRFSAALTVELPSLGHHGRLPHVARRRRAAVARAVADRRQVAPYLYSQGQAS
jgi:hypothetical protein